MPIHFEPILTLAFLSAFLPELLSTNVSLGYFFNPIVFIVLTTLTYGIPLLIIREFSIHYKLGLWSVFLLGTGYGLYNEGLHALTLFSMHDPAIEVFGTYGAVYGFRVPLTLVLAIWHGMFSVVAPIYFTHYLFPDVAEKSWIPSKPLWLVGCITIAITIYNFISHSLSPLLMTIIHLLTIVIIWVLLWYGAKRTAHITPIDSSRNTNSLKAVWLGILLHITLFVVPYILASMQIPIILYYVYFSILAIAIYQWLKRPNIFSIADVVLLGIGGYSALILTIYLPISILSGSIFALGLLPVFFLTFWFIIRKIRKNSHNN